MTTRLKTLVVAGIAALTLALLGSTFVLAGNVTLPDRAADKAVEATAEVALPDDADAAKVVDSEAPEGTPSPNAHAAFGQCVAANAKTASDNAGSGSDWNPTDGCVNTNRNAEAGARGLENANENASSGLDTASSARSNGESARSGR